MVNVVEEKFLLRKLTFSKDLALFIQSKNPNHQIWKLDLEIIEEINEQNNCIFGIMSVKTKKLLRATINFEEAKWLTQDNSRKIMKCLIKNKELWKDKLY